jgi:hypothetical protein
MRMNESEKETEICLMASHLFAVPATWSGNGRQ